MEYGRNNACCAEIVEKVAKLWHEEIVWELEGMPP